MSEIKRSISKPKPSVVRSFRLIDFHIYDESPKKEDSDSGSEDGNYKQKTGDDKEFIIQMFGINEKGETCCLYVNDYNPFFYIRVGDDWTQYKVNALIRYLNDNVDSRYKNSIVKYKLVNHHKLYGFSAGKKHQFVRLEFKNNTAMNKYKNMWFYYVKDPESKFGNKRIRANIEFMKVELELYESNIPPLLRYFHVNDISPSGWVSVNTSRVLKVPLKTTTCKYEYICSLKHVVSMPDKETVVPYKICSYDIEASSSHGDFPMPVKTYKRLVTQMVDVFLKQLQYIDEDKGKVLLQKMIYTSFGYDKFDDIDLVYPKTPPSKEKITKLIHILMNKSLEHAKKEAEEDNSDLIKIDSMFEAMKDTHQNNVEGSTEADGGRVDTTIENTVTYGKKYEKKLKVKKNTTVMDILFGEQYDRDDKIKITDEVITLLFPRLRGDEVTFIGSTFMNYGSKEPYLNHCLVVGTCDTVDGAVIETVETEKDVLLKWTELIQHENPDIIIGYNIFGFDYEFMFRRAEENHCDREFLMLSRKMNEVCANEDRDAPGKYNLEHTKLQIASGEYDLRYARMAGRLQIDMYAYFRRDFNLSSYKLDDVAGQFISDSVKKIEYVDHPEHGEITELYSNNLMGLHKGDFIHIEITGFTTDYYKDGQKFVVQEIEYGREVVEMKNGEEKRSTFNVIMIRGHHEVEKGKSIKWGMAKDDVTPQDIFRLSKGSSADRAVVAKYCIQDCNLVHHLMNKIDVITGYVEMSRICSVPISFLVFRGQGIKLTSFVAKKCRDKDTLMPDVEKPTEAEGYEGAIVLPPKCSMYMDNPVACVDYSSLYPSSMISQN